MEKNHYRNAQYDWPIFCIRLGLPLLKISDDCFLRIKPYTIVVAMLKKLGKITVKLATDTNGIDRLGALKCLSNLIDLSRLQLSSLLVD
jgi:hypothetical protein